MMAAPLALLMLSAWTVPVPDAIGLRPMLLESIGCSPLFLTLMAATLLYAVALLRRVAHAFDWLTAAIALLVVVGPNTTGLARPYTLARVAARSAGCVAFGGGGPPSKRSLCHARHAFGLGGHMRYLATGNRRALGGAILFHLLLLAMLLIGTVLRDRAARFLERAAVVVLLAACGYVMSGEAERRLLRCLCC